MRKIDFAYAKTGADQLRSYCEADRRLCFHYTNGTIPLLPKFEILRFKPFQRLYRPFGSDLYRNSGGLFSRVIAHMT